MGCIAFFYKAMIYVSCLLQDLAPVTCMDFLTRLGKKE
jgi:hypothetical protein